MLLINKFPRQIAYPFRITCNNKTEFYKLFNAANGIKSKIYFSIYDCNKEGQFKKSHIDKIAFDLDSPDSLKIVRRLNRYCEEKNLKRTFIFSTGGFWVYIFTKNGNNLKDPKNALKLAHKYICKEAKVKYDIKNEKGIIDPHINDIDFHIIGDIARVSRMPGSYDLNRKIFCIPISLFDINKGYDYIKEKAKKQRFEFYTYGEKELDMKRFDKAAERIENIKVPEFDYSYKRSGFPPCVWSWLNDKNKAVYRARFFTTVWMYEKGYTKNMIKSFAREHWEQHTRTDGLQNNYIHWCRTKVLDLVFRNGFTFPDCRTLYREGLCYGKCKYFGNANLYHG